MKKYILLFALALLILSNSFAQDLQLSFSKLDNFRGKTFYLKVIDITSGDIISVKSQSITTQATFNVHGLRQGIEYQLDFWIDINSNDAYDAPPTDYAWRDFVSISNESNKYVWTLKDEFTDIKWKEVLAIRLLKFDNFAGLNLHARFYNKRKFASESIVEIEGISNTPVIYTEGLNKNDKYLIDFFIDLNKNGKYDPPPTDIAWRLDILDEDSDGDGVSTNVCHGVDEDCDGRIDFIYNDNFTDIGWTKHLRLDFIGLDPTLGGDLYLALEDTTKSHNKKVDYNICIKNIEGNSLYYPISPNSGTTNFEASWFIDFNGNGEPDSNEPAKNENLSSSQYNVIPLKIDYSSSSSVKNPYRLELKASNKFGRDKVLRILKKRLPTIDNAIEYYGQMITGYEYTSLIINDVEPGAYVRNYFADIDNDGKFNPAIEELWTKEIEVNEKITVVDLDQSMPGDSWDNVLTVKVEKLHFKQEFGPVQTHVRAYRRGENPLYEPNTTEASNPLYKSSEFYLGGLDEHTSYDIYVYTDNNENGFFDKNSQDKG